MEKALMLYFNDDKGVQCNRCMLSVSKDEKSICAALGTRPLCKEEGCRIDCPLVDVLEED